MTDPLLKLRNLKKHFPITGGVFGTRIGETHAVDGVDLEIKRGETLGLVGESGCGKSTLGRIMVRLIDPTSGEVEFEQVDLHQVKGRSWKALRPQLQMVFQDTQSSLDPRMMVKDIISEPLQLVEAASGEDRRTRVRELIDAVGLNEDHLYRYPHEMSGGQRQRVVIARAVATQPKFIVLDEPTSALDVSVQAKILNLLKDLQEEFDLTYLFISHDLSVVRYMSDEVAIMYLGEIVERAGVGEIFDEPLHPYTRALLAAIPIADPKFKGAPIILEGDVPSADAPPPACRFHPRCPRAEERCRGEKPELRDEGGGHLVSCHFADEFRGVPVFDRSSPPSQNGG